MFLTVINETKQVRSAVVGSRMDADRKTVPTPRPSVTFLIRAVSVGLQRALDVDRNDSHGLLDSVGTGHADMR